ncbi:hypothetical protein CROQUDRAFT_718493 [Cronartium quercuum f. sp. fusiforme G11]|uniref:Uncharacterized protein n=1 Tax=Cronartium quercuum f. sp. fusiforme G11 TaxID=708437 RepID=A0A9P6NAQ6_9BASI|nr:hypothetical protein CROQUDRAFT_718493 [Cronartium quercuum f. sp. fusiforme G11]
MTNSNSRWKFMNALQMRSDDLDSKLGLLGLSDLIQRNQLKPALDQTIKLIKKFPNAYILYAIKAFVLNLLGRSDQASSIFNQYFNLPSHPANLDLDYVQLIAFTLIDLNKSDELVLLYERATNKISLENRNLAVEAYLNLAEFNRIKDMQQIALKLHKAFPVDPQFIYWILLPLIHQLKNQLTPLLISLSHRFIQTLFQLKALTSEKVIFRLRELGHEKNYFDDFNEIWVIMKILELIGESKDSKVLGKGIDHLIGLDILFNQNQINSNDQDYKDYEIGLNESELKEFRNKNSISLLSSKQKEDEVLKAHYNSIPDYVKKIRDDYFLILDSFIGKKFRENHLGLEIMWREKCIDWLNDQSLIEFINRLKKLLSNGDTNWHTIITINKAVLKIDDKDNHLIQLDDFYLDLFVHKGSERGFSLGRIDLRKRLREIGEKDTFKENLEDTIVNYLKAFGHKPCCFDDLKDYLLVLNDQESQQVSNRLRALNNFDDEFTEESVHKLINIEKICRALGFPLHNDHLNESSRLLELYTRYLPLGKDLPETSLQPADDLAILSVQVLVEDWYTNKDKVDNVYGSIYILEMVLNKSMHRYQARSLLIRLCRLIGDRQRALNHFISLGLKHIQLDTLGHLGLDRVSIFGNCSNTNDIINHSLNFYDRAVSDTKRWINEAYYNSNYSKIDDFEIFQNRIKFSLQKSILIVENIRIKIFNKQVCLEEIKLDLMNILKDWNKSIDNRDQNVLANFQSFKGSTIDRQTSLGPPITVGWVRVMSLTYATILLPGNCLLEKVSTDLLDQVSRHEVKLYYFSQKLSQLFFSGSSNKLELEQTTELLQFFNEWAEEVEKAMNGLKSEVLQIVQISYEAYRLFEIVEEQVLGKNGKTSGLIKVIKSLKIEILNQLKKFEIMITKEKKSKLIDDDLIIKLFNNFGKMDPKIFGELDAWKTLLERVEDETLNNLDNNVKEKIGLVIKDEIV